VLNAAPGLLDALPVSGRGSGELAVGVRAVLPSKLAGNGIGRPAVSWDVDLQGGHEVADLRLGDLVAIAGLDARHNMGYRRGWLTVGVVVHGASPLPGHGPGVTPILTGPAPVLSIVEDSAGHSGLTESGLGLQ
jgi:hypothetical protein